MDVHFLEKMDEKGKSKSKRKELEELSQECEIKHIKRSKNIEVTKERLEAINYESDITGFIDPAFQSLLHQLAGAKQIREVKNLFNIFR